MKNIYDFRHLRSYKDKKDRTWWILQDVCDVLKIPRHNHLNAYERLAVEERHYWEENTSNGDRRVTYFVNEAGIYCLILQSHGMSGLEFKRWLAQHVLPNIDKKHIPLRL